MSRMMEHFIGVFVILTAINCSHGLFSPSYVSDWVLMDSNDPSTTYRSFSHMFGVLPIKAEAQVRSLETGNIFPDVKTAQSDEGVIGRGGVLCRYTDQEIFVFGALNDAGTGAYTVYTGNVSWTSQTREINTRAYVRVRAWHPDDFPTPTISFTPFDVSVSSGARYISLPHNLGRVPDIITVQLDSGGIVYEAIGSNTHSETTATMWGGLVFGVDSTEVRLWVPSSGTTSRGTYIPDGGLFSRCKGWGVYMTNYCQFYTATVYVNVWVDPETQLLYNMTTDHSTEDGEQHVYDIQPAINVDRDMVVVRSMAIDGYNKGFLFSGTGAVMLDDQPGCGGLVYAYTNTSIQLWHPTVDSTYIVRVGPGVGEETNLQYSTGATVVMMVWRGIKCPNLPPVPHATVNKTRRELTYACIPPSVYVSGDLIRLCQENDTWTGEAPICTSPKGCSFPDVGVNAAINISSLTENSSVIYSCFHGYTLLTGDLVRQCLVDALDTSVLYWSGIAPVCQIVCDQPNAEVNTTFILSDLPPRLGTAAFYSCTNGLQITSGDMTRVCYGNGSWTGMAPNCSGSVKQCSYPEAGAGTSVTFASLVELSVAMYQCQPGLTHLTGNLSRLCVHDEITNVTSWTGNRPECYVTCQEPDVNQDTTVSLSSVTKEIGTAATYACIQDTVHISGDLVRVCYGTGMWTGTVPTCGIPNSLSTTTVGDATASTISSPTAPLPTQGNQGVNLTEVLQIADAISANLTVLSKSTSKYKRSLISVLDSRKSSHYIGITGVTVLVITLILLVASDVIGVMRIIYRKLSNSKKTSDN